MIILIITMMIIITIIIIATTVEMKGDKEEKERVTERAVVYYYSTETSKISNAVIFTNHIFSAYALHKATIWHFHSSCFYEEISRIIAHDMRILIFELECFYQCLWCKSHKMITVFILIEILY